MTTYIITATKEQERETLAKIKAMVERLGPDSYLAAAFEGCFEMAAQNIENDWACSQKQLADAATEKVGELEKEVQQLKDQLAESEKDYEAAHAAAHEIAAEKDAEIAALRQQILSEEDTETLIITLENDIDSEESWQQQAAATIVELADTPTDIAFTAAVARHRSTTAHLNTLRELRDKLNATRAGA